MPIKAAIATIIIATGSGYSEGGNPMKYINMRDAAESVEVRGRCVSSCVLLLGNKNSCVTPTAPIGFHGVTRYYAPAAYGFQVSFARELNKIGTGGLGDVFLERGWYKKRSLTYLSGQTMIDAFGIKECD